MTLPRISLVTPSFNQAPYLEATLESVVRQEYPDLEWIVMDGGSTDGSVEILRPYERHFAAWVSERDAGQADALRRGFARATGDILGWLNSDDVLMPGALRRVGEFFAAHPACQFLTGDSVFIDAGGTRQVWEVRGGAYSFRELLHYCDGIYLPQPSVFFTRAAYDRAGGVDATLEYAMDFDLWLRIRAEHELFHVPEHLSQMRVHAHAKGQDPMQPTLHAVSQITRRHWGSVGRGERMRLRYGLRRMHAREHCAQGLASAQAQDRRAARRAFLLALAYDPFILTSRPAQSLMARLALPQTLRARWLRVP
jgi:hypothetical protein